MLSAIRSRAGTIFQRASHGGGLGAGGGGGDGGGGGGGTAASKLVKPWRIFDGDVRWCGFLHWLTKTDTYERRFALLCCDGSLVLTARTPCFHGEILFENASVFVVTEPAPEVLDLRRVDRIAGPPPGIVHVAAMPDVLELTVGRSAGATPSAKRMSKKVAVFASRGLANSFRATVEAIAPWLAADSADTGHRTAELVPVSSVVWRGWLSVRVSGDDGAPAAALRAEEAAPAPTRLEGHGSIAASRIDVRADMAGFSGVQPRSRRMSLLQQQKLALEAVGGEAAKLSARRRHAVLLSDQRLVLSEGPPPLVDENGEALSSRGAPTVADIRAQMDYLFSDSLDTTLEATSSVPHDGASTGAAPSARHFLALAPGDADDELSLAKSVTVVCFERSKPPAASEQGARSKEGRRKDAAAASPAQSHSVVLSGTAAELPPLPPPPPLQKRSAEPKTGAAAVDTVILVAVDPSKPLGAQLTPESLLVTSVDPEGGSALKVGYHIVSCGGTPVAGLNDLRAALALATARAEPVVLSCADSAFAAKGFANVFEYDDVCSALKADGAPGSSLDSPPSAATAADAAAPTAAAAKVVEALRKVAPPLPPRRPSKASPPPRPALKDKVVWDEGGGDDEGDNEGDEGDEWGPTLRLTVAGAAGARPHHRRVCGAGSGSERPRGGLLRLRQPLR